MRLFFFLVLLAGLALGFGYPLAVEKLAMRDLGMWHAYDHAKGYQSVDVPLNAGDAPVRVSVEMVTVGQPSRPGNGAVLTLTADVGGRTVLAEPLNLEGAKPRDTNPQTQERMYRAFAGMIDEVEDATYTFTLGPGDADDVSVSSADLVLQSKRMAADRRIQPAGFLLTAVGLIGLVVAMKKRGGGTPSNPNSQPPPPRRWGRGGGSA
jgi:hypothetical protein